MTSPPTVKLSLILIWGPRGILRISEKKPKSMILNFTENFQFHTRLKSNNSNIHVVEKMKILGTIFTNKLSWQLWQFGKKSKCKNATSPESLEFWLHTRRNGWALENLLSQCVRPVLCPVAQWSDNGKQKWLGENPKKRLQKCYCKKMITHIMRLYPIRVCKI